MMLCGILVVSLALLGGCFPVEQNSDWDSKPYTLTVRQKNLSQTAFIQAMDAALQGCQAKDLKVRVLPAYYDDSVTILCYPP